MADAFEFYPCLVDDAPASIYVNLRYENEAERSGDTAYWLAVRMRETGPHGIGTAEEGEVVNAFEEAVIASVAAAGLVYAGRLRTRGIWEMTFYGPAGHLDVAQNAAHELAGRTVEVRTRPDPDWRYYRELLVPDAERKQWMDDRRLVQILQEQGDRLSVPRRVDHWALFRSADARAAFVAAVRKAGFETEVEDDAVHAWRTDPIELDHIHDVVMLLVDAAGEAGGEYDGWETSIERG